MLQQLSAVTARQLDVVFVSSLSRFSRNSTLLADAVETVLAHGGTILTTNFLLRPGETFARRPPLVPAVSEDPLAALSPAGLSGLHAQQVRQLIEQFS